MVLCPLCNVVNKRSKFLNHKCEQVLSDINKEFKKKQEEIDLMKKIDNEKKHKSGKSSTNKETNLQFLTNEQYWKLKTEGVYLLGLTRWLRNFRLHMNLPGGTDKVFRIGVIILFTLTEIGLAISSFNKDAVPEVDQNTVKSITNIIVFEFLVSALIRLVVYGYLAYLWDGYGKCNVYRYVHFVTIWIVTSLVPFGDFLIHLGYKHEDKSRLYESEKYPFKLTFKMEAKRYRGYKKETRGGHFMLIMLGYLRSLTLLLVFAFQQNQYQQY
jgi:hypothetical protein